MAAGKSVASANTTPRVGGGASWPTACKRARWICRQPWICNRSRKTESILAVGVAWPGLRRQKRRQSTLWANSRQTRLNESSLLISVSK
jgi:hypothetical protein